jgi:CHAD domain-containing protein
MSAALLQSLGELTASIATHGENLLRAYQPHDLHQFRVYMRRTQSLLERMDGGPARFFRKSWSQVFAVTGPARDLDVLQAAIRDLLPAQQAARLERVLLPRLQASHDAVTELLRSEDWKRHWAGWRGFLKILQKRPGDIPHDRLCGVSKAARRACRKALRKDTDRAWHRLRIALKNLRYVADASRNDPGADLPWLENLIAECKVLQTLLGDWHDTIVQLHIITESDLSAALGSTPGLAAARRTLQNEILRRKKELLSQAREIIEGSTWLTGSRRQSSG